MVGEGPVKPELQQLRFDLALDNVLMLPEQPRTSMPAILSAADVALVPLRKVGLFERAVPSKLFDAWACGCPVLLSIDSKRGACLKQPKEACSCRPKTHPPWRKRSANSPKCRSRPRPGRKRPPLYCGTFFSPGTGAAVGTAPAVSYQ